MAAHERRELNELKKRIMAMPAADRIAEEVRLARSRGMTVTVTEASGISVPSQNAAKLPPPVHLACLPLEESARGTWGVPSRGLGGLVAKLEGLDRKALVGAIETDIGHLTRGNVEQGLARLGEYLELLDALEPSRRATASLRTRAADAIFGKNKFKDQGKTPGGGIPPSPKAQ